MRERGNHRVADRIAGASRISRQSCCARRHFGGKIWRRATRRKTRRIREFDGESRHVVETTKRFRQKAVAVYQVSSKMGKYTPEFENFVCRRVLQDTNNPEIAATKQRAASTSAINLPNKRIDRRRASIATISQPQDHKRITRRISDLSLRATALLRSSRPSRLEYVFPFVIIPIQPHQPIIFLCLTD